MHAFLSLFWQIVLLKRGPEDIPASKFLLAGVCSCYLGINLVTVLLTNAVGRAFALIIADLALLIVWAVALLIGFAKVSRATQTLTALLGTGGLLQLLSLPLNLASQTGSLWLANLSVLAFLFILLWAVTVYGFVVARAIETSTGIGVFFASIYFLLSFLMADWILGLT